MKNIIHALFDATIMTGEAAVEGHALLVRDGMVVDIVANRAIPAHAHKQNFLDKILAPGLIDAQVNGGGGVLLNNIPTAKACLEIAAAHRKFGTTHILPTCITDTPDIARQAIQAVREARKKDASILGIHLEGPHLSPDAKGVHGDPHIRPMIDDDMNLYRPEAGEIMLITIAPESVTPQQIKILRAQGCIVSIGHTKAAPDQILAALESGASGFTHLYNAMGGMPARSPGVAGTALDDRDSWCSLIADGHHVSDAMIRLTLRAKPTGKVFLVSDAMPPSASDTPQSFQLYGETIRVDNNRCVNAAGKLAGSAITLIDAVQYCVKHVGVELDEALRMASTYPAAFLGCGKTHGKLLPGYKADVIMLDHNLTPLRPIFSVFP